MANHSTTLSGPSKQIRNGERIRDLSPVSCYGRKPATYITTCRNGRTLRGTLANRDIAIDLSGEASDIRTASRD